MPKGQSQTNPLRLTVIGPDGRYRDGAEDSVLRVLQQASDRRTGSDELAAHIRDWPTRYHLSRQRANLLRPLELGPGQRILDVGAGTGALTRYIGETGAEVVALEPSLDRARAAATRCVDLPNVRVVAGPIDKFTDDTGFDLVICVGVLEYASGDEATQHELLAQIGRLMRPDGAVVVAIENQLGLRYLLGYSEDHLGEPWAGVEDYGGQRRVRTFGRRTLRAILSDAGFTAQRWLYPYPDYKLPSTIVDEAAFDLPDAEEMLDKLLRWPSSGEASGPARLCDDRRAHRVMLRERLGADVANSFLVLAARSPAPLTRLVPDTFLAQHMGWDRRAQWRGGKRFERHASRVVVRSGTGTTTQSAGWLTRLVRERRPYVPGPTIEQLALDACREGVESLGQVLGEWRRHLRTLEKPSDGRSAESPYCRPTGAALPRQYLDVVLSNFIRDASGALHYVDDEWRADGPVDATLVSARALFWFAHDLVIHGVRHPFGASATVAAIADTLAGLCGLESVPLKAFIEAEAAFQALVSGRDAGEWAATVARVGGTSQADLPFSASLPFTTLAEAARHAGELSGQLSAVVEARDAAVAERARLEGEAATAHETLTRTLTDLAASHTEAERVQGELIRTAADLAASRTDAAQARDELAAVQSEATRVRGELTSTMADLEASRGDAAQARAALAAMQAEATRVRGELTSAVASLKASQADAARVRDELARASARGDTLDANVQRLNDVVRRLVEQIDRQGQQERSSAAIIVHLQRHLDGALAGIAEAKRERDLAEAARAALAARVQAETGQRERYGRELVELRATLQSSEASRVVRTARRLQRLTERARVVRVLQGFPPARRRLAGFTVSRRNYRLARARAGQVLSTGLFDPHWYQGRTGLNLSPFMSAFHYEMAGRFQGIDPSPLFDTRYYLEENPDVARSGVNPLLHFVEHGAMEGRRPSPLFDPAYYREQHPSIVESGENPLVHFLRTGASGGASPCAIFDTAWYLRTYPDVASSGVNPLIHYLQFGASEGRDPNPYFDTSFYLETNPDVAAAGVNPLVHYARQGYKERRVPGPRFDPQCYLSARPDVAAVGIDPLEHLLRHGLRPGGTDDAVPVASQHRDVHIHIDVPSGTTRVKRGQWLRVSGWMRSATRHITGAVVQSVGASSFALELPFGSETDAARPRHFEANLTFSAAGEARILIGARLAEGTMLEVATLPPVIVVDDLYCEAMRGHLPTPRCFSVLYLDGLGRQFQSPRYRIDHMREALGRVGIESAATDAAELYKDLSGLRRHDILVLFRAGWDWRLDAIVTQARAWNIPVVFDVDDYVFEPSIATSEHVAGIRDWPATQVEEYRQGVRAYRRTLEESDYFTASSEFLVARAEDLGRRSFLINNHLSERLVALGEVARAAPRTDDRIDIVYLSGTSTHQRDFATAVPALVDVMRERPHVRLRIVGFLDLDEFIPLKEFGSRVVKEDFMAWEELPLRLAAAHITIAPLEAGNPFCEAKSELKFFEGATAGMVVVATPTDPFRRAIRDGETGYLCHSVDQWRQRLLALVDDADLRRRLAEAGAREALQRFGPDHAATQAAGVYRTIIQDARRRRGIPSTALAINWVMLDAFAGSGGHNDIFMAANEMARRGHAVTLFFAHDEALGNARAIREYIEQHFGYEVRFEIALGYDNITHGDALIATHYTTAHVVKRLRNRAALAAYFVQDYEPYFSPVSTEYFAAEQTYRYGLLSVTLGPWLKQMVERHGARARAITFWVDPRFYYPAESPRKRAKPRVLYFARPQMARRCYDLGLEALSVLARRMPDVEICLFGAASFPGQVDFPHTALGILKPAELGELYRGGDVGLAFSTTNPSLVTFEMMACGLPLVDLDVFDSRERHGGYPALLVEPSPEAIAEGVARLVRDPATATEMSRQSVAFTRDMPTAQQALARVSEIIEDEIARTDTP